MRLNTHHPGAVLLSAILTFRSVLLGLMIGFAADLAIWISVSSDLSSDIRFPGFIGFLGWDGGVNRLFEHGVSDIPLFGGWRNDLFTLAVLAVWTLAMVAVVHAAQQRPSRLGDGGRLRLAVALAFPWMLILIAGTAIALERLGCWTPYVVEKTAIINRGCRIDRAHAGRVWIFVGVTWGVVSWGARFFLSCGRLLRRCLQIAGASLLVSFVAWGVADSIGNRINFKGVGLFHGSHTAWVAALLAMTWSGATLVGMALFPSRAYRRLLRRRIRRDFTAHCLRCSYDLRGSVAAGRAACPECGAAIGAPQQRYIAATTAGSLRDPGSSPSVRSES